MEEALRGRQCNSLGGGDRRLAEKMTEQDRRIWYHGVSSSNQMEKHCCEREYKCDQQEFREHFKVIGMENDGTCRFCQEQKDNPYVLLVDCCAVMNKKYRHLGG